jgi:hypothetical protein
MTNVSPFNIAIDAHQEATAMPAFIRQTRPIAQTRTSDQALPKAEKWTDRICLMIVAASALYFAPILISILMR